MLSHQDFVKLLVMRYDHYSVNIMANEILELAGVEAGADYGQEHVTKILEAIKGQGDARSSVIVEKLEALMAPAADAPVAEAAPAPVEEAPVEEAPAEEAPAEEAPKDEKKKKGGKKKKK